MKIPLYAVFAVLVAAAPQAAESAVISWKHEEFTSADKIINFGTLVEAVNNGAGGTPVTLNGVAFNNVDPLFGVGYSLAGLTTHLNFFDPNHPFANDLMDPANYRTAGVDINFTGLVVGKEYILQGLTGDNRSTVGTRTVTYAGTGATAVVYTGSNYGHIFTGKFVADSTSQQFLITGSAEGLLNGFQLRIAPEPGRALLLSGVMIGLTAWRSRRRA